MKMIDGKLSLKINEDVLEFISYFVGYLVVFYLISISFESYIPVFNMASTARVLHSISNLLGLGGTLNGNVIDFTGFSIQIVRQCTGIFEVMAISSCIIAYPSSLRKKVYGVSIAIPLIYLFNIGRLVFLIFLGINYPEMFNLVHDYILQLTFVFLVIFFWIYWIDNVVKDDR